MISDQFLKFFRFKHAETSEDVYLLPYFAKTHKITNVRGEWRGVKVQKANLTCFPIEALIVLENQTLPIQKMTEAVSSDLLEVIFYIIRHTEILFKKTQI